MINPDLLGVKSYGFVKGIKKKSKKERERGGGRRRREGQKGSKKEKIQG